MKIITEYDVWSVAIYMCKCPNCGEHIRIDYNHEHKEICDHCNKTFHVVKNMEKK